MAVVTILASPVDIGFIDHSAERSSTGLYVPGADLDTTEPPVENVGLIRTALAVASLCNFTRTRVTSYVIHDTPTVPSDDNAQREQALWIQYVDDVTDEYGTMSIPGADRTLFAQINTDEVDIAANVAALALIAVLETNAVSRDGNPITITRMRLIGRAS